MGSEDSTQVLSAVAGGTEPGRDESRSAPARRRAAAAGPVEALRRRLGRPGGSQHRRPLTPGQLTARRRRRIKYAVLGSIGTVLLGPVLAFALGYLFFAIPSPDDAVNNQVALVSYGDGSQLTRLVPEQGNRIKVPIEEIPVPVRNAVLAAEDRSFYSNPGFDLTGILRAAWSQLQGGIGGGSTITQQYVKKTLVGDDATLWRKYKEMILAVKLSQQQTKDEILNGYLNAIYFGRGAYGIQSASQAYYGKTVDQLSPSEGALLAGLIQSPSRWDPAINPDKAVQRWEFVMDGMVSQNWLTPAERAEARFPQTSPRKLASGGVPGDSRGHIVHAVKEELEALGISDQELGQEGLRISTTIDPEEQQRAVDAAQEALEGQPENLRTAIVAIDPATGGIRAYYGGANGVGLDYARVRKQPGSTFKPFVVLAGLQQDPPIGLGETFDGKAVPGLRNSEGADCARCDIKQAMTISNNVVFNTLARKIGPQKVADAARSAGITSPLDDANEGIALGNKEVSPLELASAYATIAAGGLWHQPHFVSKVVTADDRVLYEAPESDGERRFPERVARNVTETMLNVAGNDGFSLPGRRQVAAKTGTVQSRFEGENNDAWMSGFTPSIATTVWIGTDMNSPIRTANGTPISGKTLPGEVWESFMSDAVRDEPPQSFPAFRPIGDPPSDLAPNETPTSSTSTPTPSAAPSSGELPPAPESVPPGSDPAAVPLGTPAPGTPETDPRSAQVTPTPGPQPTVEPTRTPRQDCTIFACG
ncbi:transglycosylase domain-containing protein [Pseudonocardia sp. H11422]|uniref:transglycosylase domain-containing protein n=1 Tax=Pseudonocardia sp. H11422 TaxID=2835866 RepID=UPI0027E32DD4|nr:transglycosylase domain-containing protein [Pseudonocardia sp. H11422]